VKHEESNEQITVVSWFRAQYPKKWRHLQASINGKAFSGAKLQPMVKAVFAKKEGMVEGASDLFLAIPRHGFHGLYIEMKTLSKTSKASKEQLDFGDDMIYEGYLFVVCKGAEAAITAIKSYLE